MSDKLKNKLSQWKEWAKTKKGGEPYLSSNEAVVIWFCTGDKPEQLPNGAPYLKLLHLTDKDRSFLANFESNL